MSYKGLVTNSNQVIIIGTSDTFDGSPVIIIHQEAVNGNDMSIEKRDKLRDIIVEDGIKVENFNLSNNYLDMITNFGYRTDSSGTALDLEEMTYTFNMGKRSPSNVGPTQI